jgi:hypothetical protein
VLGNEPRHASGLRTSDTGQPPETYHPETTHSTATCSCEDCSAFTRVAARTLARSPICDLLHRRLQPFCYLHDCSGCFRLERLPGGTCTHWKAPPCHGAHVKQSSRIAMDVAVARKVAGLPNHASGAFSSASAAWRIPSARTDHGQNGCRRGSSMRLSRTTGNSAAPTS